MAAPKNNQFWKLRSKHGRDKLFSTPELLLEAAHEYFQWCDENPWISEKTGYNSNGAYSEEKPTARPYSLGGFALYVGASESWLKEFRKTADKDFLAVISEIDTVIRTQQVEGATVGAFNANIVARINGIVEKVENHNTNLNYNSEEMTREQVQEIAKKLEDEY